MQELEMSGAPFGRPPVSGIAVPPFETTDEYYSFHYWLQLYIACLDEEGVTLSTFTLDRLVERARRRGRYTLITHPDPHVLEIAVATYFPAPWTPLGIHTELETTGFGVGTGGETRETYGTARAFTWGDSETHLTAHREDDGSWSVIRWSRGVERLEATLANDDDMVLYRQSQEYSHPLPFSGPYNPLSVPPLEAAAEKVRAAWARHTTYPYIASWVDRHTEQLG
jgi:hypothetical protein